MTPTLIMTRPAAQGADFADDIRARWKGPLKIILSPLLEIVPLEVEIGDVDEMIFTSVNGVAAVAHHKKLQGMGAWCVGERTAQAADEAGFVTVTGSGDAEGLVSILLSAQPKGRLAHIRGRHARGDVSARLNAAGLRCEDRVAYDQRALALTPEARAVVDGDGPVIFPLFSARTSTILKEQGPFTAPVHAVAISAAAAGAFDGEAIVAPTPDAAGVQSAILALLGRLVAAGG